MLKTGMVPGVLSPLGMGWAFTAGWNAGHLIATEEGAHRRVSAGVKPQVCGGLCGQAEFYGTSLRNEDDATRR